MEVSLMECSFFDLRDSIMLTTNLDSLENGGHDSGFGPSSATRRARNTSRVVKYATQLGRDLLDFVTTPSSSSSGLTKRKMSNSANVVCNPPKKTRNVAQMFDSKLNTAKTLEQTMKIHGIVNSLTLNKNSMCLLQILVG